MQNEKLNWEAPLLISMTIDNTLAGTDTGVEGVHNGLTTTNHS
jgi:hypothetical protein